MSDTEDLRQAYIFDPDFIDSRFGLERLTDIGARPRVLGVSRLIVCESFDPECLFTFVYSTTEIEVSTVTGTTQLWWAVPRITAPSKPGLADDADLGVAVDGFDYREASHDSATLRIPSRKCPKSLSSWFTLKEASESASSCCTEVLDGVSYWHKTFENGQTKAEKWWNPQSPQHLPQLSLISDYYKLIRRIWRFRWLKSRLPFCKNQ